MVGRLREKQYQLAAQKQNEAHLKYNYYQETARYFERECGIARHYDSWNFKDLDFKKQLETAKKAERLQYRKDKLRAVLKEEEETYKKELEELKRRKRQIEDPSLEFLKEKLKEKKIEQSLYLPKTCRRYQSRFVYPAESVASHLSSFSDTDSQRSRVCRDSTNFLNRYEQDQTLRNYKMTNDHSKDMGEQENIDTSQDSTRPSSSQHTDDVNKPNLKYQARYSRKSLENTNVRFDDGNSEEYTPSRRTNRSITSIGYSQETRSSSCDLTAQNIQDKDYPDAEENPTVVERQPSNPILHHSFGLKASEDEECRSLHDIKQYGERSQDTHQMSGDHCKKTQDQVDRSNAQNEKEGKELKLKDSREFETEKSLPWLRIDPHDKNLSKQMFLYLTHKELKTKIDDIAKRELHACLKQSWNEALRLRDMRNRLELIREKRLYNMENLHLKDEDRKEGLASIDKREDELAERETACTDSTMYSDDAKMMWKKWVREDEESTITDARNQREELMSKLEKEWQGLAIQDKERISHTFENVLSGSSLQEEHKLTAALRSTRAKSASSAH